MPLGKVKWFSFSKGYGFITPDDGSPDVFLHISTVQDAGLSRLDNGTPVQYSPGIRGGRELAQELSVTGEIESIAPGKRESGEKRDFNEDFERDWGLRRR
jgi:CspA family cold shock protein